MAESIAIDIAVNSSLALSPIRKLRERANLARGYDHSKDAVDYVTGVFEKHSQCAERVAGNVLEIGPGGNLGSALLFLQAGADHVVGMDPFPWLRDQQDFYRRLTPDADLLLDRLTYRCPEQIEKSELPDASFDIIYSHACLEHVADPAAASSQIGRLLAPGGSTSHQIDLRDHRNFKRPLAFLRHSDRVWRAAMSRRDYTNRWRASDWIDAFESAGLEITAAETEALRVSEEERQAMHPRFRRKSLDDLGITGLLVRARKPS